MAPPDRSPADPLGLATRPLGLATRPLGTLADLSELLGGDTNRSRRFLGGLVVGALVGAAVAGTAALRLRGKGVRPG